MGAAYHGQQSSLRSLLLIEKQVVRDPEGRVEHHDCGTDHQGNEHIQPDVGEHESHHCDKGQHKEDDPVAEGSAEDNDRLVAEEVQGEPARENDDEDDHGYGVKKEAKKEDDEDDDGIVDLEVDDVTADSGHGLAIAVRADKGRDVRELPPWPAGGEELPTTLLHRVDGIHDGGTARGGRSRRPRKCGDRLVPGRRSRRHPGRRRVHPYPTSLGAMEPDNKP